MATNVLDLFDLSGLRALVTGASRGISLALARVLAQAGAGLVLNSRDGLRFDEARAALAAEGHDTCVTAFDVMDSEAIADGVDRIKREVGPLYILVNNAGVQHRTPLEDFPVEAWRRLVATNLDSVFLVGQAVARHMIGRGRGKIINVGSVQCELARPGIAPYTATKGAVKMLTKGMATDWGRHGLHCNGIGPGYFRTDLNQALVDDLAFSGWLATRTPPGRWGEVGNSRAPWCSWLPTRPAYQRTHALCRWRHHLLPLNSALPCASSSWG